MYWLRTDGKGLWFTGSEPTMPGCVAPNTPSSEHKGKTHHELSSDPSRGLPLVPRCSAFLSAETVRHRYGQTSELVTQGTHLTLFVS